MKKVLFNIILLFVGMAAFATGQDPDVIYIDGVKWDLLARPVYRDSALFHAVKAVLPKERTIFSTNWDGFTTCWSIRENVLYLDSIQYQHYDAATKKYWSESLPAETLQGVFKNYFDGKHIVGGWFAGDIRMAKGKMLYYQHTGFERNYEEEQILSIEQGKVTDVRSFQNYVVDGLAVYDDRSRQTFPKDNTEIRKMFPIHVENYPELEGVKKILFYIKKAYVDATGHLVECEVKVLKPGDNPKLAAEMAEALKAYHPWRVMFINGEYRAKGIAGCSFPYNLEEK